MSRDSREPVLTGERKLYFARPGGLTIREAPAVPRLKGVLPNSALYDEELMGYIMSVISR
jgi:hypothetical protein